MRQASTLGLAALVALVAVAGCFGDDGPAPVRSAQASGGIASDGYAYDGQGLVQAGASLSGWTHAPDDRGSYNVSFEAWGSSWQVTFDRFSGSEDFKAGGVAYDLVEHGDTGVSSTAIPRILAEVAAWGSATVVRDGSPAVDPAGNTGPWSAHLMLSDTTVRGTDGMITKADGSTPFDPDSPADARTVEGDRQALLTLTAPSGADSARAPETVNESFAIQGPMAGQSVTVPGGIGATATINISTSGGQVPLFVGDIQISITDGNGTELASAGGQVLPNEPYSASFPLEDLTGDVTVQVNGNGTYQVDLSSRTVYNDHPFIVLTWDDYSMESSETVPG